MTLTGDNWFLKEVTAIEERCPLSSMSTIERFHCIVLWDVVPVWKESYHITSKGLSTVLLYHCGLGDRITNWSIVAHFAYFEARERKLNTQKAITLSLLLLYTTWEIISYRNASNKRPVTYLISKLFGGRLFEKCDYKIASVLQVLQRCKV